MSEPVSHLRAEGQKDFLGVGQSACGRQVDTYLLGDSSEDIECRRCRATDYYRQVHIEEFGEEPDED